MELENILVKGNILNHPSVLTSTRNVLMVIIQQWLRTVKAKFQYMTAACRSAVDMAPIFAISFVLKKI